MRRHKEHMFDEFVAENDLIVDAMWNMEEMHNPLFFSSDKEMLWQNLFRQCNLLERLYMPFTNLTYVLSKRI